jgi:hypothetical protein
VVAEGRKAVSVNVELLVDDPNVAVVRLNGRPREPLDGRHRRVVVYIGATVATGETVLLLRDAATRLEKTLPRDG